ncbi:hypothetical protein [Clostridium fallax]|uniref:Uncharacterized protein n=1 Tax=Clostridium fallax TaxID=1533 RepID=A0A1M4Z1L0_9CLOT|nr:hypothetical protein [Clostridium fallax]SHF11855.1 hypothetical protein SAMN05443638_13515 [Clostridium fallax]SQB22201.1 Uncharacterised protein [Clostridium fallax]
MTKLIELEEKLKELKLQKRNLLLADKNTDNIDTLIKEVEKEIKDLKDE